MSEGFWNDMPPPRTSTDAEALEVVLRAQQSQVTRMVCACEGGHDSTHKQGRVYKRRRLWCEGMVSHGARSTDTTLSESCLSDRRIDLQLPLVWLRGQQWPRRGLDS